MSRFWWRLGWLSAALLLTPTVVLADNCGDLHDCWNLICDALAAAGGIGGALGGSLPFSGGGGTGDPNVDPPQSGDDTHDDPCTT